MRAPIIVWFRQDLRLSDNPALAAAAASGDPILPLYILDDGGRAMGGASRWWLHGSLTALDASLKAYGGALVLRRGDTANILSQVIAETGARSVYWNRCYEPHAIARDAAIKSGLTRRGIAFQSFNASLLFEPWTIQNKAGGPYKVFTQFWKSCLSAAAPEPPQRAPDVRLFAKATGDTLAAWRLLPEKPDWAGGLRENWTPGERGARARLDHFLDEKLKAYREARDMPALEGTSRLSPHLHFGDIGPRQIWQAARTHAEPSANLDRFLAEIGWREFSYHLLFHFAHITQRNLRAEFDRFPWEKNDSALAAWQRGRTGYPIVDAGMRELWHTGWMHNRVRMIVASFLVKDLLIDWRAGEAWFWDTLVDADLANNAASWQWVAGSGADAAPYFRIFNPVLQGEKFDPQGDYVRRYVPELAGLPAAYVHKPWTAPAQILRDAGVTLGKTYPLPIVDHAKARDRALAAFATIRKAG